MFLEYPYGEDVTNVDGVAVTVQRGANSPMTPIVIPKGDYSPKTINQYYANIQKGEKIYFRISSRYDGRYDQVNWDPIITYTSNTVPAVDGNNKDLNLYRFSEDFVVSNSTKFIAPKNGVLNLILDKKATSDDVKIILIKNSSIFPLFPNTFSSADVRTNYSVAIIPLQKDDEITINVSSDTNIHWPDVSVTPKFRDADGEISYSQVEYSMYNKNFGNISSYLIGSNIEGRSIGVRVPANFTLPSNINGEFTLSAKEGNRLLAKTKYAVVNGQISNDQRTAYFVQSLDVGKTIHLDVTFNVFPKNITLPSGYNNVADYYNYLISQLINKNFELIIYSNRNFINSYNDIYFPNNNIYLPNQKSIRIGYGTPLQTINGSISVNDQPAYLNLKFIVIGSQPKSYVTLSIDDNDYTVDVSNPIISNIRVNKTTSYTLKYYSNRILSVSYGELSIVDSFTVAHQYTNTLNTPVFDYDFKSQLPAMESDSRFGSLYRGWGSFIVNGNNKSKTTITNSHDLNNNYANAGSHGEMRVHEPILFIPEVSMNYGDETNIPTTPSENDNYTPNASSASNQYFVLMSQITDENNVKKWIGLDEANYVTGNIVNSSRLGEDNIDDSFQNTVPTFSIGDKLSSLIQKTKLKSISAKGNIDFKIKSGVGGDGGISQTIFVENKVISAVADYNGDNFPDHVIEKNVQFTNSNGFLSSYSLSSAGHNSISRSSATGVSAGAGYTHGSASNTIVKTSSLSPSISIDKTNSVSLSGNYGFENEYSKKSFIDINGDGLPDRIDSKNVELGTGYGFDSFTVSLGFDVNKSKNENYGGGAGISLFGGSIQGGISFGSRTNLTADNLVDINGDGLLDHIDLANGRYDLNLGNVFISASSIIPVKGYNEKNVSVDQGTNFGFSIPIGILTSFTPNPPFLVTSGIKIIPSYTRSSTKAISKTESAFRDMNGDGYPDYVTSDSADKISVQLNQLGQTFDANGNVTATKPVNLLSKVTLPMGGSWEVTYERKGNTYEMPQSKYVLASVTTKDGFTEDNAFKPDVSKITVEYGSGFHSRRERTFYGFESVKIKQLKPDDSVYRYTLQNFNNQSYYLKGSLINETLFSANNKKWNEKLYFYSARLIHETNKISNLFLGEEEKKDTNYAYFLTSQANESKFYEGEDKHGKSTKTEITAFDEWGNPKNVKNYGDPDIVTTEELISEVIYQNVAPSKYIIMPVSVVSKATGVTRSRTATYDPSTGNLKSLTMVGNGNPTYHFYYDIYGNIIKSEKPVNYNGERFFHEYIYDPNVFTYPIEVKDAFGYSSKSKYNYKFGVPTFTEDMNLQPMQYKYDDFGRNTEITGPYEMFNSIPWTVKFDYAPITTAPLGAENAQSYAKTRHYDPEHPGSYITTITISDGLGTPVQVKKTGAVFNGSSDEEKFIVAGKVQQDVFGRALKTYYPTLENIGANNTKYNAGVDTVTPTVNTYDVLDRVTSTKLPGEDLFSTTQYGFGKDRNGRPMFKTVFKDELGTVKESYTDIKGRTTTVKEPSNTGDIITSFTHDALGSILEVKDVNGNLTLSSYDNLGRRISYRHPDSGTSTFVYDPAGNMTSKTNSAGETVTYEYDFTRLRAINYTKYPENNVKYYYGKAKDASAMDNNAVGRLWYQTDATGTQYLKYGRLGELTYQRRSVAVPGAGVYWFGTEWQYDTWNRIKNITYPDGEIVIYHYNKAGNLKSMVSKKDAFTQNIVNNLGYDKFEQRVLLEYGNGTKTTYEYQTERRRLLKLNAQTKAERPFMQNVYQYDAVSNVLQIHNNAPFAQAGLLGGGTNHAYGYDDLYRLTSASGNWRGMSSLGQEERQRYTVTMAYDNMHNVTRKEQKHERSIGATGISWLPLEPTSYRLNYKYPDAGNVRPHAPVTIVDEPNKQGALCCDVNNPQVKFQDYTYDAKGNPTEIVQATCNFKEPKTKYLWDEENRLRFVDTNPSTPQVDGSAIYTYDAGGERIIKNVLSSHAIRIFPGEPPKFVTVDNYNIYPNGLINMSFSSSREPLDDLTVLLPTRYTKHYYIGTQRISSKLGLGQDVGKFNCAWLIIPFGSGSTPINDKIVAQEKLNANIAASLAIMRANNITPPVNYGQNAGYNGNCVSSYAGNQEKDVYWYHPDHLGSSSFITGLDGEVTQNIEYFPSGEVFVENHKNSLNTPYKFNGKELDNETGYYYYGARYYNPRTSIWLNVDPLAVYNPVMETEFYGDGEHNGGVYNSGNLNPYIYTYQNPIRYIDPNGKQTESYATKRHDDNDMSQVVKIRGGRYYQNTTNVAAKFGNWLNSLAGGDSDYFVEKKPYNGADNRFIHEAVDTSAGALIGGGISKLAGPLLSNLASKVGTKVIPDAGKLLNSMLAPSKGGMSAIGRAFQKHAGRAGSTFEKVAYSGKTATKDAMGIVDDIVSSNKQLIDLEKNGTKTIYDKVTGRGFNINRQGEFGGFRELPQRNINNVQKVIKK